MSWCFRRLPSLFPPSADGTCDRSVCDLRVILDHSLRATPFGFRPSLATHLLILLINYLTNLSYYVNLVVFMKQLIYFYSHAESGPMLSKLRMAAMPILQEPRETELRRVVVATLTLGIMNGLLLGVGLTATNRSLGLLLAFGPGTLLTLFYVCTACWKRTL